MLTSDATWTLDRLNSATELPRRWLHAHKTNRRDLQRENNFSPLRNACQCRYNDTQCVCIAKAGDFDKIRWHRSRSFKATSSNSDKRQHSLHVSGHWNMHKYDNSLTGSQKSYTPPFPLKLLHVVAYFLFCFVYCIVNIWVVIIGSRLCWSCDFLAALLWLLLAVTVCFEK